MISRKSGLPQFSGLILLALLVLSSACSKKSDELSFPIQVKMTGLENQEAVRVFTKRGEVTDQVIINRFIAGSAYFNLQYMDNDANVVEFSSDSTAQLGHTALYYKVKKDNGTLTLSSGSIIMHPDRPFDPVTDVYRLCKNTDSLVPVPDGANGVAYSAKERIVLYGDYKSFKLPVLGYRIKRVIGQGTQAAASENAGLVFNEFNESFRETLGENDTVAVQQMWWRFK